MNANTVEWTPDQMDTAYAMFDFAVRLGNYAEARKRLADNEQDYWQGVADTCRKLISVFIDNGLYSELFCFEIGSAETAAGESLPGDVPESEVTP